LGAVGLGPVPQERAAGGGGGLAGSNMGLMGLEKKSKFGRKEKVPTPPKRGGEGIGPLQNVLIGGRERASETSGKSCGVDEQAKLNR